MSPDIIVPLVMGCAMLWWIGRGLSLMTRLLVTIVTLGIVAAILTYEKGL